MNNLARMLGVYYRVTGYLGIVNNYLSLDVVFIMRVRDKNWEYKYQNFKDSRFKKNEQTS